VGKFFSAMVAFFALPFAAASADDLSNPQWDPFTGKVTVTVTADPGEFQIEFVSSDGTNSETYDYGSTTTFGHSDGETYHPNQNVQILILRAGHVTASLDYTIEIQ